MSQRSKSFKALEASEHISTASEERQLQALSEDGMLFKRPLFYDETKVLVGFNQAEWEEALLA